MATQTSDSPEFGPEVGYRRYVGPAQDYDIMAALQFTALFALGLREEHYLLDIGCGSLRGGRLFIPYLAAERYYGVEPNEWLVKEGIAENVSEGLVALKRPVFASIDDFSYEGFGREFDFILAQSILSHTYEDLTLDAFRGVRAVLAQGGTFVGTFCWRRPFFEKWVKQPAGDTGRGWVYPDCVTYTPKHIEELLAKENLAGRVLPIYHPRQTWFAAVRREEAKRLDDLEQRARNVLHAPSTLQLTKKRAYRLAYLQAKRFGLTRSARAARAGDED
jgi:cyclopropane fatty-acyl-phospholipid synthase-like methyltransferase